MRTVWVFPPGLVRQQETSIRAPNGGSFHIKTGKKIARRAQADGGREAPPADGAGPTGT